MTFPIYLGSLLPMVDELADPAETLKPDAEDSPDILEDIAAVEAVMKEAGYTPSLRIKKLCQIAVNGKSPAQIMAAMDQLEEIRSHARKKAEASKFRGVAIEGGQVTSEMGLPSEGGPDLERMETLLKGDKDEQTEEVSAGGEGDISGSDDYFAGSSGTVNRSPTRTQAG